MKKNTIEIALDAGFSGNKIAVNKNLYDIPFSIQDITDEESRYELRRIDDDYVRVEKDGRIYLIGRAAKEYALDMDKSKSIKTTMEAFSTMERYNMQLFEIALQAFLVYGLQRYAKDSRKSENPFRAEDIENWDIHVGVALPHEHLEELAPIVNEYLDKGVDISIMIGTDKKIHYKFTPASKSYNSQVVSMLYNEVVTNELDDVTGEKDIYSMLPALVLDAGYKTLGKFKMAVDSSIVGDDSDTNFAMLNINEKVVAEINAVRPGFSEYQIDEMCAKGEVVRYIDEESDKPAFLDVRAIKEKHLKQTCDELIAHLCAEYDNLLDFKCILIGGGTGEQYYPYIKDFCEKERSYLKVILAGSEDFYGKPCGPVHAIVAGLFKEILTNLEDDED